MLNDQDARPYGPMQHVLLYFSWKLLLHTIGISTMFDTTRQYVRSMIAECDSRASMPVKTLSRSVAFSQQQWRKREYYAQKPTRSRSVATEVHLGCVMLLSLRPLRTATTQQCRDIRAWSAQIARDVESGSSWRAMVSSAWAMGNPEQQCLHPGTCVL